MGGADFFVRFFGRRRLGTEPMNEDAALLRRYAEEKSEAAFAELVQLHLDLVYPAALRRLGGDTHAAADVAQQVFTTLARDAKNLSRHSILAAWLYTATRNAAIDHIRSEQRRAAREQHAQAMQNLHSQAVPDAEWEKLRPVLDEAMDALPEADRAAVLLRFFEQRPFAEIGRALRLSEDAARMRVDRALDKLHTLLARRGVTSTGAALATVLAHPGFAAVPAGMGPLVTAAALAGARVGGGAAMAATVFMSKSTLVASAAALAAVSFAVFEIIRNHELTGAKAAAGAEVAKVHQPSPAVERPDSTLKQTAVTPQPPPVPQISEERKSPAPGPASNGFNQAAALAVAANGVYAPLFQKLNFKPEQREQFTKIVSDWKQQSNEIFSEAVRQGMQGNADLAQRVASQTTSERDAKIRATFGDATLQAVRNLEERAPVFSQTVGAAGQELFHAGLPLSNPQNDRLIEIMAANTPLDADGKFDFSAMNREAVLAQAERVLTPEQISWFRPRLANLSR
jgi:RNA polymerase sigma factor (sigma-70 family)